MKFPLLAGVGLVFLGLVRAMASEPAAAPTAVRKLVAETLELEPTFGSQRLGGSPWHEVGEELVLDGSRFAVHLEAGALKLAPRAGQAPSVRVEQATTVELPVPRGETTDKLDNLKVHLRPRSGEGAGWEYAVVTGRILYLEGGRFILVDADGDGRFDGMGSDAWTTPDNGMLIPLGPELIVNRHALAIERLSADGLTLSARVTPLEGNDDQLSALVMINRLRVATGLPPVVLDPELSRRCTSHALYLQANGWDTYTDPHDQDPAGEGYTAEGAETARRSQIMGAGHRQAMDAFWRTFYHRVHFLNPALEKVGINAEPRWLTVIDASRPSQDPERSEGWADPVLCPPDGSRNFDTAFCFRGESPEPVPRPWRRGNPLMVYFPTGLDFINGFKGTLEELTEEGTVPVATLPAAAHRGSDVFGIVPESRLRRGSRYRVTFTWSTDDDPTVVRRTATFSTR